MVKIPVEKAVEIALEQHEAGNFARAEALYLEILRQHPGNADAIHLLGVLATQGKKPDMAIQLISAAIRKRPDEPRYHYNLAEAYSAMSTWKEAASSYRRAIELDPEYIEAHSNLANVLNQTSDFLAAESAVRRAIELDDTAAIPFNVLGDALRGQDRIDEAIEAYEKTLARDPKFGTAMNSLAGVLRRAARFDESIATYRRVIQLEPAAANLHNNLGAVLAQVGRNEEAGAEFQIALDLEPEHLEALNNLGAALKSLGQIASAEPFFRKAIELEATFVEPHINLSSILTDTRRYAEALEVIDAAIALRPKMSGCHFFRGIILRELMRFDDAIDSFRVAQELHPDEAPTLTAIGYTLLERGDLDEAMDNLRRSIALSPSPQTHSNVMLTMNYHPGFSAADLLAAHQSWAEQHEKPHRAKWLAHGNDRSPDRKLRIGYVSPDFRSHAVSYFFEPLLRFHDHENFEIFGYAHLISPDGQTWQMRAMLDHWRETAGRSPDEMAAVIREDKIDILVELAGHTANNSLPTFARRPAPVQINMLGFPSTTGLTAMDYRVTDALSDPVGVTDQYNTESLIRLPDLFWAYLPPDGAPDVGPLPADRNDHTVTFTCVNNFTKVTPQVQHLWAQLLHAVPKSRLIFQAGAVSSLHTQRVVKERFAAVGVSADRLIFRPWSDFGQYMQLLTESDMTLDPFPFNGGTTTCHSLWMGAPVITLAGDRHASRMGLSMMTAIGLPEFVAHTPEEYVQIGVKFANDLPRLREIRSSMRDRLLASPLLDGKGYTKNLEAAYRDVWKKWCAKV